MKYTKTQLLNMTKANLTEIILKQQEPTISPSRGIKNLRKAASNVLAKASHALEKK